jgi:predicted TPR repeat methyltransferase
VSRSLPPEYFDHIYAASPDPWDYETSDYEAAKYRATLDALPRRQYASAFEIGCSIGVLTDRLAARCARLLAVDVAECALDRARERCRHLPQVRFARMQVPVELPDERFDLIVLSEVGYYLSRTDLWQLREGIVARLDPGGHLVLVHWTPAIDDAPLTGDEVHQLLLAVPDRLAWLTGRREQTWRLDVLERQRR